MPEEEEATPKPPQTKGKREKAKTPGARFYVYEMKKGRKRREPLREATARPLTLKEARDYARIGAKQGEHDRVVMTSPKQVGWKIHAWYEAGTGRNVTKEMLGR